MREFDGECLLCRRVGKVSHLPIYIIGSEGTDVCESCRINITHFVRCLKDVGNRAALNTIKKQKKGD
jgi:hypothetical protein